MDARLPSNFVTMGFAAFTTSFSYRLLMGIVDDRAKTKSGADNLGFLEWYLGMM